MYMYVHVRVHAHHDGDPYRVTTSGTNPLPNRWGYHVVHLYLAISSSFAASVLKS